MGKQKKNYGIQGRNGWSVQSPPDAKPSDKYREKLRQEKADRKELPLRVTEEMVLPTQPLIPEDAWIPPHADTEEDRVGLEEPQTFGVALTKGEYNEREDPDAWARSKRKNRTTAAVVKPKVDDENKPRRTRRGKHPHTVVPPVEIDAAEAENWRDYVIKGGIIDPKAVKTVERPSLASFESVAQIGDADKSEWTDFIGAGDMDKSKDSGNGIC